MVPPGRIVPVAPPLLAPMTVERFLDEAKRDSAQLSLFEKKNSAWAELPIPLTAEACVQQLKAVDVRVVQRGAVAREESPRQHLVAREARLDRGRPLRLQPKMSSRPRPHSRVAW